MIQLLLPLVIFEMAVVLALLFATPVRKIVIMGLDLLKQSRGPLIAKTVAGTILVVFSSTLFSAMDMRRRALEGGMVNPTDDVLMAHRLLEASLMGFVLFLAMITDRLHSYIRELHIARSKLEVANQDYHERKSKAEKRSKTQE